jgi:hypothetical protein
MRGPRFQQIMQLNLAANLNLQQELQLCKCCVPKSPGTCQISGQPFVDTFEGEAGMARGRRGTRGGIGGVELEGGGRRG